MKKEVTLSSSISATNHVASSFKEHSLRVNFSLSAIRIFKNKLNEWANRERERAYLLTEDQLVIKEEEDSLLATSIRLIDP